MKATCIHSVIIVALVCALATAGFTADSKIEKKQKARLALHGNSRNSGDLSIFGVASHLPQLTMDRPCQTKTKSVELTVTEKRIVPFG